MTRHVVGCMSGTSLDAIDAALVRIDGVGLAMRAAPVGFASVPLAELADPLRRLAQQTPMASREIAELSREFSLRHAEAIRRAIGGAKPDLIAVHGQTVYHAPPVSWQLLTPAVIYAELAVPLVYDLRAADLAAGGQGAPITPIADFVLFRHPRESRCVINLGGFANFTWLPAALDATNTELAQIRGGDLCACNQFLDGLARICLGREYDDRGAVAADGLIRDTLRPTVAKLFHPPREGRSLGTADEPHALLQALAQSGSAADVLATACDVIARAVSIGSPTADAILLAGGGAKNECLVTCIRQHHIDLPCGPTNAVGIPIDQREAVEIAILGALCQDRVPITLPQVTHCEGPAPVAGSWLL